MSTGKTNPTQAHPSLVELQRALRVAENATPSRPRLLDANEQRALQLIARMQADYKKSQPFVDGLDIPGSSTQRRPVHEMAGVYAR
jgi:hypothetical protein